MFQEREKFLQDKGGREGQRSDKRELIYWERPHFSHEGYKFLLDVENNYISRTKDTSLHLDHHKLLMTL